MSLGTMRRMGGNISLAVDLSIYVIVLKIHDIQILVYSGI